MRITPFLIVVGAWEPNLWRHKPQSQIPTYIDYSSVIAVEEKLSKKVPLVISEEIDELTTELEQVADGKKFLFMGGDCAETFREHSADNIILNYQLFILANIILMKNTGINMVKIARMAGQFSKPRSKEFETVGGEEYYSYKGDMINREGLTQRKPDPELMLQCYAQSIETMNLLRALSNSKFSNINLESWVTNLKLDEFMPLIEDLKKQFKLLKGCGVENSSTLSKAKVYTGHEGLLLQYEQALTKVDRFTKKYYDCSSHFLWIGERTRSPEQAHVEFFRGINNPIGIKISEKIDHRELLKLLNILNPDNNKGRITLITRMGKHINEILPNIIDLITENNKNVIWVCDPMHGNGAIFKKRKTRYFNDIMAEIEAFFNIHKEKGTVAGGIHLEMTGRYVTECIGGRYLSDNEDNIFNKYETSCDPRLNMYQTIEIVERVSELINDS